MTHDLLTKLPGIALFSRQQQVKYTEDAERTWSTLNQALLGSWECCTRVRSGHSWAECCWQGCAWGGHRRGDLPLRARGEGLGHSLLRLPPGCRKTGEVAAGERCCARGLCYRKGSDCCNLCSVPLHKPISSGSTEEKPMSPGLRETITLRKNLDVQASQQHC